MAVRTLAGLCALVLWSVRARLTSSTSIHQVTWHVNISSNQSVASAPEEPLSHQKLRCMAQNAFANCSRAWRLTVVMSIQCWMFWGEPRGIPWGAPAWLAYLTCSTYLNNSQHASFIFLPFPETRTVVNSCTAHLPWSTWNKNSLNWILKLVLFRSRFRNTITVGHSREKSVTVEHSHTFDIKTGKLDSCLDGLNSGAEGLNLSQCIPDQIRHLDSWRFSGLTEIRRLGSPRSQLKKIIFLNRLCRYHCIRAVCSPVSCQAQAKGHAYAAHTEVNAYDKRKTMQTYRPNTFARNSSKMRGCKLFPFL